MASRIGPRRSLIGRVFKYNDAIAIAKSLTEYSTQSKDKKTNQGKGRGESRKDNGNNRKDWGQKSLLATREDNANRRARKRRQSREDHASYATVLIGYLTVRRRNCSMLLLPNSRATILYPRKNSNSTWVLSNVLVHSIAPINCSCTLVQR